MYIGTGEYSFVNSKCDNLFDSLLVLTHRIGFIIPEIINKIGQSISNGNKYQIFLNPKLNSSS